MVKSSVVAALALVAAFAAAPAKADVSIQFGIWGAPAPVADHGRHWRGGEGRWDRGYERGWRGDYRRHREQIPPHAVMHRLSREGFYGFDGLHYRADGHRYVVRAYGPRGRYVRVSVDASSGHVVDVRPLGGRGYGNWGW